MPVVATIIIFFYKIANRFLADAEKWAINVWTENLLVKGIEHRR